MLEASCHRAHLRLGPAAMPALHASGMMPEAERQSLAPRCARANWTRREIAPARGAYVGEHRIDA